MKIVVIGGTGLIGSKVVAKLAEHGQQAIAASAVDTLAGPRARYFGVVLDDHTLLPATSATVFSTRFAEWLVDNACAPVR